MNEHEQSWDEDSPQPEGPGGLPVEPARVWHSVRDGWKWVPSSALAFGAVGVLIALFAIGHTYQTRAVLVYEPQFSTARDRSHLGTMVGMFTLPGPLSEVRKRLLSKESTRRLGKRLDIWLESGSNLVTVVGNGRTGQSAAKLVNTSVDVFLEEQAKLSLTRTRETTTQLERTLEGIQAELDAARAKRDTFRRAQGIVDFRAEFMRAQAAVDAKRRALSDAIAEGQVLAARAETLGNLAKSRPAMRVQSATKSNPAAQRLRELRGQLASLEARLSPEHPQLAQLRAQIASLQAASKRSDEVVSDVVSTANPEVAALQATLSGTRTEQAAASERIKSLEKAVKEAEQHLAKLSSVEAEALELIKAVELAERRVEEVAAQVAIAAGAGARPDFRILSRAAVPRYPEQSLRRLVVAGTLVIGALFGFLWLIVRTVRDGKVHTAREAAFWSKLPVVASSTWPRQDAVFHRFVDELNDHATRTKGATLLVSVATGRVGLASNLADTLGPLVDAGGRTVGAELGVSGADVAGSEGGDALAISNASALAIRGARVPSFHTWRGTLRGPDLRRASRLADRVVVLVESGEETFARLASMKSLLGRDDGVAVVMLGLPERLIEVPDRVGDVDAFWGLSK